jgi:hypothetical protein
MKSGTEELFGEEGVKICTSIAGDLGICTETQILETNNDTSLSLRC